jgi:hypothetical protein
MRYLLVAVILGFLIPDANACCFKLVKRHRQQVCYQQVMVPMPMPVCPSGPVCPMPPVCPGGCPAVIVPPGDVCPACPPTVTKPAHHHHW